MKHLDAPSHVRGESEYIDDVTPPTDLLHAAVFGSPVAHGFLRGLHLEAARALPGVLAIFTAADIPGENQIGPILPDEPLFAAEKVMCQGQPTALVVAQTPEIARKAVGLIKAEIDELPPITDPREAWAKGQFIAPPRTFAMGDIEAAWGACDLILEGRSDCDGQEHLYLETQRARAFLLEGQRIKVMSSTQSPYAVQKAVARVLGFPHNQVEIDVRRLGGGFGGKEDQATPWSCLAALATYHLRRPVELVLNRIDDLRMTGKRHPYSADFKIGATKDGQILAFQVYHYQNSGWSADLSTSVLERTLFHSTNAYFIPNVRISAAACRTNLPSNTAFRGFGGPQGMFAIEAAITKLSEALGIRADVIQAKNLLGEGDSFSYGQIAERVVARRTWDEAKQRYDLDGMIASLEAYNASHKATKKGLAVMPICFGISFTTTFLNQASALLHVYTDGSVSLSSGGVEMGQGLNSKLVGLAAQAFGIRQDRIFVESTNTTRVANMSPSAASATADLNGHATLLAIEEILARLRNVAAKGLSLEDPSKVTIHDERVFYAGEPTAWDWKTLVFQAYFTRVGLSAHAFYATPSIHFDKKKEKGHPFGYHTYGTAILQVTLDCLRGRYTIDTVRIVHDLGRSLNELVDIGQIEGALAQGLGWMTMEELSYNTQGRLLSHALSTYKAPDASFMPDDLQIHLLEDADNPIGPYGSKAVGEPPLMYGLGVYFALRSAIRAFLQDKRDLPFYAPMTPERALLQLHSDRLASLRPSAPPSSPSQSPAPRPPSVKPDSSGISAPPPPAAPLRSE